jgi:hypothetical protein
MTEPKCERPVTHRRFWPGKAPDFVCENHAEDTKDIGASIGWYIHVEPVEDARDLVCACTAGRVQQVNVGRMTKEG